MDPHRDQRVLTAGAPLGEGRAVVVMVHGRNAGPENILTLVPALDRPELIYLAPTAAGGTWYPYSFLTDISQNEPYLSSALGALSSLIETAVTRGIRKEQIVLLGFSQGACLSSEFAARHATRYGGVIAFSGGVIGPSGTTWTYPGSLAGTPVFLGCSDVDAHVPKTRVDETAKLLSSMGADVTKKIYPDMGHLINDDEIAQARNLLDDVR